MKKILSLFCFGLNCIYAGPKSSDSDDDQKITPALYCSAPMQSNEKRSLNLKQSIKQVSEEFLLNILENIIHPNRFYMKLADGQVEGINFVEGKTFFQRFFLGKNFKDLTLEDEYGQSLMPIKILAFFKQRIKRSDPFLSDFFHSKTIAQDFKKILLSEISDMLVPSKTSLPESPSFEPPKINGVIYAKKDYDDYGLFLEFFKKNPKKTLLMIINKFEKKCSLFIDKNLREKNLNFVENSELNVLKNLVRANEDYFLNRKCNRPYENPLSVENTQNYTLIRKNIRSLFDKKPMHLETYKLYNYEEDVYPHYLLQTQKLFNNRHKYADCYPRVLNLKICKHEHIDPKHFLKKIFNFNFSHKDYVLYATSGEILEKVMFTMNSIFMELFLRLENKKINKNKRIKILETINNLIVVNEVIKFYLLTKFHPRRRFKISHCDSDGKCYAYFNCEKKYLENYCNYY